MKVGIVGLGFMSVAHIKGYRQLEDVEIVAVCNPSGRRLDGDLSEVAGNVGDQEPIRLNMEQVTAYQDFDSFLAHPDMNVVDICTPTKTHLDLSRRALAAGHHVLCEKPLSRSVEECEELVQAAAAAPGVFMPAMCLRFWPEWAWLKEAIESKRFGPIKAARFHRVAEAPAWGQANYFRGEESGGALFDLHVHDVDFVQYCFGKPSQVFSSGFSKVSGAIDHVLTQYVVESGACVSAEGSWAMTPGFGFNMAYTAIFESATIDYDLSRGDECLRLYEDGKEMRLINASGRDGYAEELAYFLQCARENRKPTTVSVADGLTVTQICVAEEESVRTRKPVTP